ncbi:Dyp-type peroxidase [Nannocystis radixulma]|uniref:Dyp-type peroxidase n=1 Tax=Nannocystis radixulma TaxID=2995305 RepID=A0ABT5BIW9_9BACT|nr:Dyp-type peroxidase [Nannocystis radixulma]MDC0672906.1 Dyp-type peroxidase [Nannocystis radixulma]
MTDDTLDPWKYTDELILEGAQSGRDSLSTESGDRASRRLWRFVQRGLVYPAPHAVFVTYFVAGPLRRAGLAAVMRAVQAEIDAKYDDSRTSAVVGVGFDLWRAWCAELGEAPPAGMALAYPDGPSASSTRSSVLTRPGSTLVDSRADLWFHIKSDRADHAAAVHGFVDDYLGRVLACVDSARTRVQAAATKSNRPDQLGGKVLGARFSENLQNPSDPVTIQEHVLIGLDDPAHLGGSFVLAQRFYLQWERILDMSPTQIEDMVGRKDDDIIIPSRDTTSHLHCARVQDEHGRSAPILRLGLPFGQSRASGCAESRAKGASLRDEAGLYFAGYARSAASLERVVASLTGDEPGFMRDRLLGHARADLGGLYYVPNRRELGLEPEEVAGDDGEVAWDSFPGVDWSRLDRHFQDRSANGWMHYNHKEYLFAMSTMSPAERAERRPPSTRVLRLLAAMFSRWQDNWYFERAQDEMEHLSTYVARAFGPEEAERVMRLSVVERTGWAIRMAVGHVLVSDEYGRASRGHGASGTPVRGADTYQIHPLEILVGAMPTLSIGQGRYMIDYARAEEGLGNFFGGLSYASCVGHVVPDLEKALKLGLGGLRDETRAHLDAAGSEPARAFYRGVLTALQGVSEHCRAYAQLARRTAAAHPPADSAIRDNLGDIAARMDRLAAHPPRSFVEAAQLVFTLHSCLHHVGEVTAIGRLDQLLGGFYDADCEAGILTEDTAQEIIDCLWIKLGEKVQLNRLFLRDHQPHGNLAMGGISGNYPQGSSNNQWIQQVTVGGTHPDDSPGAGRPAYNAVTMLCLRAARRLPLNAPCLSLRVRKDIPDAVLREASLALLSGGAHPILLHDDKIIPGLVRSGEAVGAGAGDGEWTPVAAKASGLWRSGVALGAARDYACDGCYEPQLAGKSWFTLGGFNTLDPLEAALNRGKAWASAGPMWLHGVKVSFTSPDADTIASFDELVELFLTHLRWMYAKQIDGLLAVFGQMSDVCPTPLLSALTADCLAKGLDLYGGGARYNVVAPCFTGLSTVIDSLYAIRSMVFERATALTSLSELVQALRCDWGHAMSEPFISTLAGPARIQAQADRYRRLREHALSLPRYGRGHSELDAFGDALVARVAETAVAVFTDPAAPTARKMVELARRFGTAEQPFGGFQIQPGVGTFENYYDWGAMAGASADGRRRGDPIASDLSPAPSAADRPAAPGRSGLIESLSGYSGPGVAAMWDGAPTDMNIREDFPADDLVRVLRAFADGAGSNVLTITCADPETMVKAAADPERYDLLRVRMGGWSEFFVAMFPGHQAQHQRRPWFAPDDHA